MPTVLVIDDEKEWLDLYAESLVDAGYLVSACSDGREAVKRIREDNPDAAILDIRMCPSGRDVLRLIKNHFPELPVVISSAYGGYCDDPDFSKADAFIEKSTNLRELLSALGKLIVA